MPLSRLLTGLLFGVEPVDPPTIALAAGAARRRRARRGVDSRAARHGGRSDDGAAKRLNGAQLLPQSKRDERMARNDGHVLPAIDGVRHGTVDDLATQARFPEFAARSRVEGIKIPRVRP